MIDLSKMITAEMKAEAARRVQLHSLSRRQVLLGLLSIDITADMVADVINMIADPIARAAAMIEWENATNYERDHPLVAHLAAAFSLPAEQVDALWIWAAAI